VTFARRV